MATKPQLNLSGGELAPAHHHRADLIKYMTGLRTLKNCYIKKTGGVVNRPGSKFVAEVKDSSKTVRLIDFVINKDIAFSLEFGDQYLRFHYDGDLVYNTAQNITAITNASPGVLTYSGSDTYANGDHVYVSGIVGPIGAYLNGRTFKVASVDTGANTFQLNYLDGTAVNTTPWGAYTSGGTVEEPYELSTPFLEAHLAGLNIAQAINKMTIVHPSYAPMELAYTSLLSWSLDAIIFEPEQARPTNVSATGVFGAAYACYKITAVSDSTGEESLPGMGLAINITGATQANPCVITAVGHGIAYAGVHAEVYITGVLGMTELNNRKFIAIYASVNTLTLYAYETLTAVNSTGYTAYSSAGTVKNLAAIAANITIPAAATPATVSFATATGASKYNIYKLTTIGTSSFNYAYLGTVYVDNPAKVSAIFQDVGATPDPTDSYPGEVSLFASTDNYPSAVGYFQQRRIFSNTNNNPNYSWMSEIGCVANFASHLVVQDNYPIQFNMLGKRYNHIKHIIDIGNLIFFTSEGEWMIHGNQAGIITPSEINPKQHSYNGSGTIQPIIVDDNIFYLQANGKTIRDLLYSYEVDKYRGNDLTVFASHLFEGYQITSWTFQKSDDPIVWAVRDDGVLLGLSYNREHEIRGWHKHDFDGGTVESVCAIPNGSTDDVYVVVKRTIGSSTKRYVEKLSSRFFTAIEDAIFMDSTLSYDGRNSSATTMTLSGGSTWLYDETLTITASAGFFTSDDVGHEIHLTGADGEIIRFTLNAYTNTTVMTGKPNRTVPASLRTTATAVWTRAVDQIAGLWHLEGKTVSVFGDGFVVASPKNSTYGVLTVANGSITLDDCYGVVHVGLPYVSDIETLNMQTTQGESMTDKGKLVSSVVLHLEDTRGVFVGPQSPSDDSDDPLENLNELKLRDQEDMDDPTELVTDSIKVNIEPRWNNNGRIFVRQVDPVPMTVNGLEPAGFLPIGG